MERNFCLQDVAEDDVSINNRLFLQTWNIRFYPPTIHACLIKPISWSILWIISLKTRELVKLPHSFNELIKSYPWYTNQSNKNDFLFSLYTFPVVTNTGEFDFEALKPRCYKCLWLYKKMDIEVLVHVKITMSCNEWRLSDLPSSYYLQGVLLLPSVNRSKQSPWQPTH